MLEGFIYANENTWCYLLIFFIANSTIEAEFIALTSTSEKVNWFIDLLYQTLYFEKKLISLILIYCESTIVIGRVQNRYIRP